MKIQEFQNKFGIIGKSKKIRDLVAITMQVSQSDISVLIYGESGTGKEVFAKALHGSSRRAQNKLVSLNCGAIPEGILESELFGHKKGSFTGAVENRKGYFEVADKGTLFLDEIAELALTTQVKLLRILETNDLTPIGGEESKHVDVRIIAATNKDLQVEVDNKRFRNDLYFRLKAVTLYIPPLRKRKEDIPLLAEHFAKEYSEKNKVPLLSISEKAMNLLISYKWPGNIRELKNVIETAMALNRTGSLTEEDFVPNLSYNERTSEEKYLPVHLNRSPESVDREMIISALIEIKKDLIDLKNIAYENLKKNSISENEGYREIQSLDKIEKEAIINTLKFTKWNKKKASELLGISERTLHRKIKEYEI